jgi:hypothetical protein
MALAIIIVSGALAQASWVAHVRAQGSVPVPAGVAVSVSAQDFDDVNNRLTPVIEQALMAQGYRITDADDAMQLTFDTELSGATLGNSPGDDPTASEVGSAVEDSDMFDEGPDTGPHPQQFEGIAPQATIPLGAPGRALGGRYSLWFVLGQPSAPPIWQGAVTARLPQQDPYEIAAAMVPLLVRQIGKTVDEQNAFPPP